MFFPGKFTIEFEEDTTRPLFTYLVNGVSKSINE